MTRPLLKPSTESSLSHEKKRRERASGAQKQGRKGGNFLFFIWRRGLRNRSLPPEPANTTIIGDHLSYLLSRTTFHSIPSAGISIQVAICTASCVVSAAFPLNYIKY